MFVLFAEFMFVLGVNKMLNPVYLTPSIEIYVIAVIQGSYPNTPIQGERLGTNTKYFFHLRFRLNIIRPITSNSE